MSGLEWSGDLLAPEESTTAFNSTTYYTDNASDLSCVAMNIQNPEALPYPATFLIVLRALQSLVYFLCFFFGGLLNLLVIILVAKYKKLQNHSFGIAVQVSAVNVVLSILYLTSLISAIAGRWVLGEYLCIISAMLLFITINVRTLLMFVFVVDRFLFVFFPFTYPKHHRKVVIGLLVVVWVFSIAAGIPPIPPILDCYTFHSRSYLCSHFSECGRDCSLFSSTNYTLIALPATVLPTVLYAILFIKAWKIKKSMPSIPKEESEREWKATITFAILFVSLFAATLPSITTNFIINRVYAGSVVPPAVYAAAVVCTALLTVVPVTDAIVILRNRDIREAYQEAKETIVQRWCARKVQPEH